MGALVEQNHENPYELLGPHEVTHEGRKAVAVRAFLPDSKQAWVLDPAHKVSRPMRRIHPAGVYEAICPIQQDEENRRYQLRAANAHGELTTMHDPYSFGSYLTEFDLHLLTNGDHWRAYDKMGAQVRTVDGVAGVNFAVWAPNAVSVSVVGDFNSWDKRSHPMRKHIPCGIWEVFIPGMKAGDKYKFSIKSQTGEMLEKSDPYGFAAELPPCTASVVSDLNHYEWSDANWMENRTQTDPMTQPVSVYEVHLGSWKRGGDREEGWYNYREMAHQLVEYCHTMGYTHLELLPISEHPFTGSWGYQTVGYFATTSRYGSPEDFMYFVDYCHQNGVGVILDWVPAHFPKDGHGLANFDGTALYEHADPRQGEHPDWGTKIFNYGRDEVANFLLANALFLLDKYHIDGLRVDAVASMLYLDYSREDGEWVPNEHGGRENIPAIAFLKRFNEKCHGEFPGVMTIAEESTAWGGVSHPTFSGGLGFSFKWNMGWMNDTLRYMRRDPVYRGHHQNDLTFSLIYAFTENFTLPLSHDEVVHGKGSLIEQMPGDLWQKFANLRLLYSYMWTHPGKKLLFMGGEFAQWKEWDHDSELDWDLLEYDTHKGIQQLMGDLNRTYRAEPSLHEQDHDGNGFEWIDCQNGEDSILVYRRNAIDSSDFTIVACNFTPVVREGYKVGLPIEGEYNEIFNSDSSYYGGTNVGNGVINGESYPHHGLPCSAKVNIPPLGVVILKPNQN
jgi:1,4-alpha-glucan branching enzyme